MGELRGVHLSSTLRSIITEIVELPQESVDNQVTSIAENDNERDSSSEANADARNIHESTNASPNTSSSPRSTANSTPAASIARAKETKWNLSCPLKVQEARSMLQSTLNNHDTVDSRPVLPLAQISALKLLLSNSSSPDTATTLTQSLEQALRTPLIFTSPTTPPSSNPTFEKRLAHLRQLNEERSYLASTSNIQKLNAHSTHDDINVKSMMYATSVGLNMIVAPVSFGVFMYFFAGSLFGRFFPPDNRGNNVDVRQVIAGVLSGVILLFIEMILFVIRSHELDASVRKKKRRREYRSNPFGYTSRAMERVYEGE
ncbi:hypothetical protein HJC23_013967 [Cyclotella cryptica]|uniref:ATPase, vacuolar ER assembly factor, Vma12 n=1 Tax=Cyclotella cryptica TaxID=29204 RepID=A0ABD3Q3H2_9STRA|eukprot:CCRYP_009206-RA/>CCRYP_009206-RA protein AED:0.39 eAED:0.39 QI:0/-1/0/1/-1/1/1/0/315